MSTGKHMLAGATAGFMEHVAMYPFDTVKTQLQTQLGPFAGHSDSRIGGSVTGQVMQIVRREGVRKLFSGVTAVVAGAVPAHAFYFAAYELGKQFTGASQPGHHPIAAGCSGIFAVLAHDAISTPVDVIKQRMQMANSPYASVVSCAKSIFQREGLRAFFVSYPTTVMMAIPQTAVHFAVYESLRTLLGRGNGAEAAHRHIDFTAVLEHVEGAPDIDDEEMASGAYAPWKHLVAGCGAGAAAAVFSNPLDVIKTRLQTQSEWGGTDTGLVQVAQRIAREQRLGGFFRGCLARVLYFAPSGALAWTSYEYMKWLLAGSPPPAAAASRR